MVAISLICIPQKTVKARIIANINILMVVTFNYNIQSFFLYIFLRGFMKIIIKYPTVEILVLAIILAFTAF